MNIAELVISKLSELLDGVMINNLQIDLLEYGLDSYKAIGLIGLLEEEFLIDFKDDDLVLENFRTIEKIVSVIESYKI